MTVLEGLEEYFKNTSREQVEKDRAKFNHLDEPKNLVETPCRKAFNEYLVPRYIVPKEVFEAGWNAAIEWAVENATSDFYADYVNEESILKGLE